jgi:hypothetical protein
VRRGWVHSYDLADEAWEIRHGWQGEYRPWIYGEPCPAQMRDRLAPEWRHFDAKGQPHFVPENAAALPGGGVDESLRVERDLPCDTRSDSSDPTEEST